MRAVWRSQTQRNNRDRNVSTVQHLSIYWNTLFYLISMKHKFYTHKSLCYLKIKHMLKILMCIDLWNRILVKLKEIQQATVRNTSSCLSVVYWPSSQNPQGYRYKHCQSTCSIWFLHFTQQLQLTIWSQVHRKHQRVHTISPSQRNPLEFFKWNWNPK